MKRAAAALAALSVLVTLAVTVRVSWPTPSPVSPPVTVRQQNEQTAAFQKPIDDSLKSLLVNPDIADH